jgi:hypothetical protein
MSYYVSNTVVIATTKCDRHTPLFALPKGRSDEDVFETGG